MGQSEVDNFIDREELAAGAAKGMLKPIDRQKTHMFYTFLLIMFESSAPLKHHFFDWLYKQISLVGYSSGGLPNTISANDFFGKYAAEDVVNSSDFVLEEITG